MGREQFMPFVSSRIWLTAAVGLAAVAVVSGCGGGNAPVQSSSNAASASPSAPPVDPNIAFAQFEEARMPLRCSTAWIDMTDPKTDFNATKVAARGFRDVLATYGAQLDKIAFPTAAQPIAGKVRDLVATELDDLDALTKATDEDNGTPYNKVLSDDAAAELETDELRAALGHPLPRPLLAANELEMAVRTYYLDSSTAEGTFDEALARDDINGAKSAGKLAEAAAQRLIDRLGTIEWPPGFDRQEQALRDNLHDLIEYVRRQVDFETAAQLVQLPEYDPAHAAVADAYSALSADLVKAAAVPGPKC
jgi:hypothetical protein